MSEEKFIKGFIKNLEKDLMNRSFSMSLTLMDTSEETRIGASHYPFSHLELSIPEKYTPQLVQIVDNLYEFDFLQLSLFVNTLTELHNAYCYVVEDSCIINYFLRRNIGTVYVDDPEDKRDLKNLELNLRDTEFYSLIGEMEDNKFKPFQYNSVPVKEFNQWLGGIEDIRLLEFEPDFPADDVKKQLEEYKRDPLRYKEIFDFSEIMG